MCDMGDAKTRDDLRELHTSRINERGCSGTFVSPAAGDGPLPSGPTHWAYTIGLTESFGTPELVVADLDAHVADQIIEAVRLGLHDGESLEEIIADLGGSLVPVHLHHVTDELFATCRGTTALMSPPRPGCRCCRRRRCSAPAPADPDPARPAVSPVPDRRQSGGPSGRGSTRPASSCQLIRRRLSAPERRDG